MSLEWRLVDLEAKDGRFNTNLDLAVIEEISNGRALPMILFSEWQPTVSLGRSQGLCDVDENYCDKYGVKIVRRKSGGQSVYLDEGYIVMSVVAPQSEFKNPLMAQTKFSNSVKNVLNDLGISAEHYPPGNVVVNNGSGMRTIANSGKVIRNGVVFVQGSVRYDLPNFDRMLDVLRINGESLHEYSQPVRKALAHVREYNPDVTKEQLKQALTDELLKNFEIKKFNVGNLTEGEIKEVDNPENELALTEERKYGPRGICYLSLNGKNFVPEIAHLMPAPYNEPIPELTEVAA